MARQEVLIQMVVDGRAVWQIRKPVERELCRKMSQDELRAIGDATAERITGLVRAGQSAEKVAREVGHAPDAEAAATGKRKR